MNINYKAIRDAATMLVFTLMLAAWMISVVMDRHDRSQVYAEMRAFMATGRRFPLEYGLGICERVRRLEVSGDPYPDAINCDEMRNAITQGDPERLFKEISPENLARFRASYE